MNAVRNSLIGAAIALAVMLAALVALAVVLATPAYAATTDPAAPAAAIGFSISLVTAAQFVLATLLPLLVAVVTTRVTHSGTKAWLLALFSLVASLLGEAIRTWQEGGTYDLGMGLILGLPTFITAVGMYYGLWKPVQAAQAIQANVGHTGKHAVE